MSEQNPITGSIDYLVECGWTREQATNLCRAIKSEQSPEHLWQIAPKWIEHCGESMQYVQNMLGVVALGLVNVMQGENGEWLFSLNEAGIKHGESMGLKR